MSELGTDGPESDKPAIPTFLIRCRNNSPGCTVVEPHPKATCALALEIENSKISVPLNSEKIAVEPPSQKPRRHR